jgi:class 3 adenylate cyclase
METYGLPGRVHVSAATRRALGNAFRFEPRGSIDVKGKGPMETYFLYRQRCAERPFDVRPCSDTSGAGRQRPL